MELDCDTKGFRDGGIHGAKPATLQSKATKIQHKARSFDPYLDSTVLGLVGLRPKV